MVVLNELSLEVIEAVELRLRTHHFARLIATGDRKLAALLRACRYRECTFTQTLVAPSSLVERDLLGTASAVTTLEQYVNFGRMAPHVRKLVLTTSVDSAYRSLDACVDLTALALLESFSTTGNVVVKRSLALPPSVTKVELAFVGCDVPILALESCASLTRLHLNRFESQSHVDALLKSAIWPQSLASLRLNVHNGVPSSSFRHLPPTLTNLSITARTYTCNVDVSALLRSQSGLQALSIGVASASITAALPSSLKVMVLANICLDTGADLLPMFLRLPAGLTRFSFHGISTADKSDFAARDIHDGLQLVLPRLPLQDVLAAMCATSSMLVPFVYYSTLAHQRGHLDLSSTFSPLLRKYGLAGKVESLHDEGKLSWRLRTTSDAQLIALFSNDEIAPSSLMRALNLIVRVGQTYVSDIRDLEDNDEEERTRLFRASVHLLECGFTNTMVLPDHGPHVLVMSPCSLRHLVSLTFSMSTSSGAVQLFRNNALVCLEKMHVVPSQLSSYSMGSLVTAVCDNPDNFPRLELIQWSGGKRPPSRPVIQRAWDVMRLRLVDTNRMVFAVE